MRIVFFGTPKFAIPTLEQLISEPQFQVVGVVTQPDKKRGRGNQLMPSPIKALALTHELPIWQPARIKKDPNAIAALRDLQADVFVVVAYGQILSQEILDLPKLGCINVHGSILPKYRGAAPIQRCLTEGVTTTGITTMLMDAGMDTGAMLLEAQIPVGLLDNAHQLATKLAPIGANLLVQTLVDLNRITPTPQEHSAATYAPPIQKSEYTIDWTGSAPAAPPTSIALHNQIRGFYPDCVTTFRGQSLKITASVPLSPECWAALPPEFQKLQIELAGLDLQPTAPGTVVKIAKGFGPIVQTGSGYLLLREVQLSGKRTQTGMDLVNGTRLAVGEVLGAIEESPTPSLS
jgi:methionyl-tRNA formyltransferase